MLQVIELSCEVAEKRLFKPVSFNLRPGMALQLQGANGIGKTTLLRSIMALQQNYSGSVQLQTKALYIAHHQLLHPDLTVQQNLAFLGLSDIDTKYFAIAPLLELQVRMLSAGQKQRVSLTRLLHATEKLWILDEPYANLDLQAKQKLYDLLALHLAAQGALLIVSHEELGLGASLCLS